MQDASYEFDAIVIGSGVSGGWAAKELTEKGMKVLMLDRGYMVEHGDYPGEGKGAWELPFRGQTQKAVVESDYFKAKFGGADGSDKTHYFNNDRLNPYAYDEGKDFRWVRPAIVGGKSILWGRVSLRWNATDFEANKKDGNGNDWPIRYEDIAPWYDYVESYAGIAGNKDGLDELPDGQFQPPHPMNAAERWVQGQFKSNVPGRHFIHNRVANMTEDKPEQGRSRCQSRSQCARGCSFGAYFSTQAVTLPAARATGNLTLVPDAVVTSLEYDEAKKRVTGVRVIDANTKEAKIYRSRIVFLCASTLASVQILLNSRAEGRSDSFANQSGTLGRYVMDHIFRVSISGEVPGFSDLIEYGRRPGGIYIPRFRNLRADQKDEVDFLRGYGYQGGAGRGPKWPEGFGADMKQELREYGPWRMGMMAFGECLPYRDNTLTLSPTKVDRYGVPLAVFNVTFHDNEYKMMADAKQEGIRMLTAAGLKNVKAEQREHVPGDAIHEMGGARMGHSPQDSVVNKWSQAHDAPNLFITDGAQMASTSCVNPSITFMALTARAADYAVKQVQANVI
ncbi:GMC family oxidoreductase [Asticcacaulis sp. AC460]|uniref:GMC oxidoreductase n=1 Tax=Asticcacaulis sp. AC460 TaxID=1282360 RepID=UPI0003C3B3A8|nr:GMC family oxidoreductase [Asticcacaulis sp. AC460]ESQ91573.1 GMC family oxidoreductase [Asticcacaulis sp. AC460]